MLDLIPCDNLRTTWRIALTNAASYLGADKTLLFFNLLGGGMCPDTPFYFSMLCYFCNLRPQDLFFLNSLKYFSLSSVRRLYKGDIATLFDSISCNAEKCLHRIKTIKCQPEVTYLMKYGVIKFMIRVFRVEQIYLIAQPLDNINTCSWYVNQDGCHLTCVLMYRFHLFIMGCLHCELDIYCWNIFLRIRIICITLLLYNIIGHPIQSSNAEGLFQIWQNFTFYLILSF